MKALAFWQAANEAEAYAPLENGKRHVRAAEMIAVAPPNFEPLLDIEPSQATKGDIAIRPSPVEIRSGSSEPCERTP